MGIMGAVAASYVRFRKLTFHSLSRAMLIYLIRDRTNGKGYVGQTVQTLRRRWAVHLADDLYVDRAIRAHGLENFEVTILANADNLDELNRLETHYILAQNTIKPNGYNLDLGGNGRTPSIETRAKISAALTGRKRKPFSQEWRDKIRAKALGRKASSEAKAHISAGNRGKKRTPAQIAQMSATTKKQSHPNHTAETKRKMSNARKAYYDRKFIKTVAWG
jgi:group I intron endonuclease